jgi:DNA ligase 1
MNRFAELLDRLAFQPQRNMKLRVMTDYMTHVPDPERGWALAALTGSLSFQYAKPAVVRGLVESRVDPVLFGLSWEYVGDMAETIALIWPKRHGANISPTLSDIVETLATSGKAELPRILEKWLDALDANGRWALIKLITGALRIGVSARLAKTAVAAIGNKDVNEIEELWPGLVPPYTELFHWLEGKAEKPVDAARAVFRPVMLAHPVDEGNFSALSAADFLAEWKWDGIRVQAVSEAGKRRLYSRTGEDIGAAFPDVIEAMNFEAVLDGELLIIRDGEAATFNDLQQRLNRKIVTPKMLSAMPAGVRAYDVLMLNGQDLRPFGFAERRQHLETFLARTKPERFDLSPLVPFSTWGELAEQRAAPPSPAVEGVMLKRRDSAYVPGRVKGMWWKWKRDPHLIDAVLMYAQRGSGKRSSFYSDYTFGVWKGDELVPVGKAYFGFTDEELKQLDRYIRNNTTNRFGPVREVTHARDKGLVLEVAFEGLQRSTRHRSGVAMRFPRINRLRWDKPPGEADTIENLEKLLSTSDKPEDDEALLL